MINSIKFCKDLIDMYIAKYPQLDVEIIVDIIDVVINRASSLYFNYDMVQEHPEFCIECGKCCENLGCSYFDGRHCMNYGSRFDACMEFPAYEINGETGIMTDPECHFACKLAEMVLDEEFERNMELFEID